MPTDPFVTAAPPSLSARILAILVGLIGVVGVGVLAAIADDLGRVRHEWAPYASVAVVVAMTVALSVRTGGRPVIFGALALLLGGLTIYTDQDYLRTGAAVMTCMVASVLAVMITVPAAGVIAVVRECLIAMVIGAAGALATVGFEPTVSVRRFEYVVLAFSLILAFGLVYRLGAGLHGLGRRGAVLVIVGGVVLAFALLYAELLRRYGTTGLIESLQDVVRWSRDILGAFPRPVETLLGIPALAWGVHMRSRRRQGWWVCAFGVAATSSAANALVDPASTITESALSVGYGLVIGLVIGLLLIRIDMMLTGSTTSGRRGRRAKVAAADVAVRPEPRRFQPLS